MKLNLDNSSSNPETIDEVISHEDKLIKLSDPEYNEVLKKHLTGRDYWSGEKYDRRTTQEKSHEIPGDIVNIREDAALRISTAEDPLVVGTHRYGRYEQDDTMVPIDLLEDQIVKDSDFVPVSNLESRTENPFEDFENEDITQSWEKKPALEEDMNFLLGDSENGPSGNTTGAESLVNGKTFEEMASGGVIQEENIEGVDTSAIQQSSLNRQSHSEREIHNRIYGKKGQQHKTGRLKRSIVSKNAKTNNNFKPHQKIQKIKQETSLYEKLKNLF